MHGCIHVKSQPAKGLLEYLIYYYFITEANEHKPLVLICKSVVKFVTFFLAALNNQLILLKMRVLCA